MGARAARLLVRLEFVSLLCLAEHCFSYRCTAGLVGERFVEAIGIDLGERFRGRVRSCKSDWLVPHSRLLCGPMNSPSPRICIIGAGISGIATGKFLKEK